VSGAGWNYADVWEAVAERFPDEPAQICDDRSFTWSELERRADALARHLVAAGLGPQAKVAQYLHNGPAYLESVFACFKASLVPVNTNYRYTGDELDYLWRNADVQAVVADADLIERCAALRERLPQVRRWIVVGAGPVPDWAVRYEDLVDGPPGTDVDLHPRSGADLLLLYTGGTTGQPKGVMWPQDSLFRMLEELNGRRPDDHTDARDRAGKLTRPGPRVLPAPPLMHGTALWFAMPAMAQGGAVVTIPDRRFEPDRLLDVLVEQRVKGLCIVGDAFARPLVDRLDAQPGRWDLSGLRVVFSSGVVFSSATKARLAAHAPNATIVDSLGSSESGGLARASTRPGEAAERGIFRVGPTTRVVDDDGNDVEPGSGQRGRVAVAGHIPIGYYGDPVKTAETFVALDGVVHVVAGDWAEVREDGAIALLGRGSVCINTGGEKVYPEEVEEAVRRVPEISDVVVVGVPDERFGEAVTALVEVSPGAELDVDAMRDALRDHLAGYKVPRHVLVHELGRGPNGKADYGALRDAATRVIGRERTEAR
jgi:fatty-acyl-CoA synthase